ncbi:MAG: D-aminoacylase [Gemmatimonadetes bacterium]|nr:D-aminoacylase [Gemmatimonadota bacterium]
MSPFSINRRTFVSALAAAWATGRFPAWGSSTHWAGVKGVANLLLRRAVIYDGTGGPPFTGDVAISGDRITAVGPRLAPASGAESVDLAGLALAPGFIDCHSHTDLVLLVNPRADGKIRQGVTTEIVGQDGSSIGPWREGAFQETRETYRSRYGVEIDFRDLPGFFRRLETQGSALNLATMIGHGTLRAYVVGNENRPSTAAEREEMARLVAEGVRYGICGLSSGLEYVPGAFGDLAELAAVAAPLRGTGLLYASHLRNEDDFLTAAVEECFAVGRRAGIPAHVSHIKAQGQRNWWKAKPVLAMLESAKAAGQDVDFDVYPYVAYSTGLSNLFPAWARAGGADAFLQRLEDSTQAPTIEAYVRDKIDQLGSWDAVQITSTAADSLAWARGGKLGALATTRRQEPYALLVHLIRADRNNAGMIGFGMSDDDVARFIAHPLSSICSDGSALATEGPLSRGSPHPRNYGAFPRVLGRYCREQKLLPLETAIHKMTGRPAARFRLKDRGVIAPGVVADLVAFDPARISDRATFEQPHQYAEGVVHVVVGGTWVLRDGQHTDQLPGKVVRPTLGS